MNVPHLLLAAAGLLAGTGLVHALLQRWRPCFGLLALACTAVVAADLLNAQPGAAAGATFAAVCACLMWHRIGRPAPDHQEQSGPLSDSTPPADREECRP